jgi:uncharacterized protein
MRDRPPRAPHTQWNEAGERFPVRTCVACRARRAQSDLLRLARGSDGTLGPDPKRRVPGRGWYVCSDNVACRNAKLLGRFARNEAGSLAHRLEVFYGSRQFSDSVMSQ